MTGIGDLDTDILRIVFQYLYDDVLSESRGVEVAKKLLPLAAVCSCWRMLMLPYVHKRAFLDIKNREPHKSKNWLKALYRALAKKKKHELTTNVDLIISQNCSSHVKEVEITINRDLNIDAACEALDLLGFGSVSWKRVLSLFITMNSVAVIGNFPASAKDDRLATRLTALFNQHIPNINHLMVNMPVEDICKLFTQKMIDRYLKQLSILDICSYNPIALSNDVHTFNERIAQLNMRMSPKGEDKLPNISASSLQSLTLQSVSPGFTWSSFIGNDSAGYTNFARLRKLCLSFSTEANTEQTNHDNSSSTTGEENSSGLLLRFPKLQTLTLMHNRYSDASFYNSFANSPLKYICVIGSFNSLRNVNTNSLLNLLWAYIHVSVDSPVDFQELSSFVYNLFASKSDVRSADVIVDMVIPPIPIPSNIQWTFVERFSIGLDLHLSSIFRIIQQCPMLGILCVKGIENDVFDDIEETIKQGAVIAFENTKLENVDAYNSLFSLSITELDTVFYLMLAIRSLKWMLIPNRSTAEAREFIASNSASFPHLGKIRIE